MVVSNGWNDVSNQAQNEASYTVGQNMYYQPYPGYISNYPYCYPNYPYTPTQYLTYPIYQTDPKVIELLEAIEKLLENQSY